MVGGNAAWTAFSPCVGNRKEIQMFIAFQRYLSRKFGSKPRPSLVQVIGLDGPTEAQEAAAELAAVIGVDVVTIREVDARRKRPEAK